MDSHPCLGEGLVREPRSNQPGGVTLGQLVSIRRRLDAVEINHVDLHPTFDVFINTEHRDIGNVALAIRKELENLRPEIDEQIADTRKQLDTLKESRRAGSKDQLVMLQDDLNGLKRLRWSLKGEYARMNESFASLTAGLGHFRWLGRPGVDVLTPR